MATPRANSFFRSGLAILFLTAVAAAHLPASAQTWYYTRLKQFDAPPPPSGPVGNDGSYPRIRLIPHGGAYLGGTDMGGLLDAAGNGKGTLFTITPGGSFTRIHSFDPAAVYFGQCLTNLVAGEPPDTAFYGQMMACGPGNLGRIFKLDTSTTPPTFTTLYSFSLSGGWDPEGGLAMGSDGWFYGTTLRGGASDRGTIFRFDPASIQPDGTGFQTLHSFDYDHGAEPRGDLVRGADGKFYGTTYTGGSAFAGTIFRLDPSTTPPAFTWLYDFPRNGSGQFYEGSFPLAGVVEWGGYLYGTALFGGADNRGTIFKFDPAAKAMVWVKSFTGTGGAQPGGQPNTKLVLGARGTTLYGTAVVGGAQNSGTVFSVTSTGTFTKLYSFSGWDGQSPLELTEVSDGILLGTTYIGAALGGNVFKLEAPGTTATVSGGGTICGIGSATIQAALTGPQPWNVTWSDGVTQTNITTSPVTRPVSPSSTTVYTLTAFTGAGEPGTTFGSATVTVSAVPAAPAISAPTAALPGRTGLSASVQSPNGSSTYTWTIANGAITSPAGPPYTGTSITFTNGLAGTTILSVVETNAPGCAGAAGSANVTVTPAGALLFYPLYPCRLFHSGSPVPAPPIVGPPLAAGETRTISVAAGECGIPPTARALALNATVFAPATSGYLVLWAAGQPLPGTSSLNFPGSRSRANNAIVTMPGTAAAGFSILNASAGGTGLILDVAGYFE